MNYKTYAEAKIANPDSEIVTTGKNWSGHYSGYYSDQKVGTFEKQWCHIISESEWVICNPADHCSSLKEFLESGLRLAVGDVVMTINCSMSIVKKDSVDSWNHYGVNDNGFFILSASALNGGCKIPPKAEQWSVHNNTIPLCELTDEQYGKMRRAHDIGATVQSLNEDGYGFQDCSLPTWISNGVYRIKSKSERELFIENTTKVMRDAGTKCPDNHEYFGIIFDAGARYTDKTQFFGESI